MDYDNIEAFFTWTKWAFLALAAMCIALLATSIWLATTQPVCPV